MTKYILHKLPEEFIITSDEKITLSEVNKGYKYLTKPGFTDGTVKTIEEYERLNWQLQTCSSKNDFPYLERAQTGRNSQKSIGGVLKVIAQQDQIDFSNLTAEEQKKIEFFDIMDYADKYTSKLVLASEGRTQRWWGIQEGFKKAQELLSDKKFTLDDMKKAITDAWVGRGFLSRHESNLGDYLDDKIKSLSQSKSWNIEIQTECSVCGLTGVHKMSCKTPSLRTQQPRFTNEKIKITKVL